MNVTDMRLQLMKRYPSGKIRGAPIADMSNERVIAIYRTLIDRKDPLIGKNTVPKKLRINPPVKWEQLKMELDK